MSYTRIYSYSNNDRAIVYYKDKERTIIHREDGPAIEHSSGKKEWGINGARHRENGPAIEHPDGEKEWYINGKCYSEEKYWAIIKFGAFV